MNDYEKLCLKIKRWRTRAKRAATAIVKLERQKLRMDRKAAQAPKPTEASFAQMIMKAPPPEVLSELLRPTDCADLAIPDFLDRTAAAQRDKEAATVLRQEIAEKQRARAVARISRMKAKQSGATKQMPLQGRDALRAIDG